MTAPALSIVIPAYNEAERIVETIRAWSREVCRLGIVHEILVYDDGSTDATADRLAALARELDALRVTRHENRGHGPTILRGYLEARGDWVLQIDGDDEVGPAPFEAFWRRRDTCDLLIGCRAGRRLGFARRLLTRGAALAVRLVFGGRVSDANSPYRLIRRSALCGVLPQIPADLFAPNVAVTGLAIRNRWRLLEQVVTSREDPHGRRASWGAAAAGWLALRQLLSVARASTRVSARVPASSQRRTR